MKAKGYWPVILWAGLIFCLHIIPSDKIPKPPDWSLSADKLVHFLLFGVLSFLILRIRYIRTKDWQASYILNVVIICTVFGLLMETIQLIVPGRTFNLLDLVADAIGVVLGCMLFAGISKRKNA